MRKLALILLLAFPALAEMPKTSTADELKAQLATANLQIAQLNAQVHELQFELQLYEAATGQTQRRQQDQQAVEQAKSAIGALPGTWVTGPQYGAVSPLAVTGVAVLVSGTVTVTNAAACTPSSSCSYSLTRCIGNSSTAVGTPTVGTVSAGTSFVINSLSSTNTTVTGDLATVCWRIN